MDTNDNIQGRSFAFALRIVKLFKYINSDSVGKILGSQILRSGTSIGANIEEAYAAQSRSDFIHKMSLSLKEARETNYWLRILRDSQIVDEGKITEIINESDEIKRILGKIVVTAKNRKNL